MSSLRRRLNSQIGGGQGAAVLTTTYRRVGEQFLVTQWAECSDVQVQRLPSCLRLRAFGDGLVMVVRLRIIILYLACAEFEEFNFVSVSQVRWMHSFFGPKG